MIPAKIIEISDKVLVEYLTLFKDGYGGLITIIAEVENVIKWSSFIGVNILENDIWTPRELELNQIVFIEPTTEGRCKIVKLN